MGGRRYLGIESGNGDYSLEIGNPRIASAGIESGWSGVPAGRMIYISGILTGSTYLKVTDNATQETLTLPIKVVDYYEDLNLIHGSSSLRPNGDENLLPGVDDIFLVSNAARDAYFFKQGQRTETAKSRRRFDVRTKCSSNAGKYKRDTFLSYPENGRTGNVSLL